MTLLKGSCVRRLLLCLFCLAICSAACAEGETQPDPSGDADTGSNDAGPVDAADTNSDDADARDAQDGQAPVDMCAVCCPGGVTCIDGTTRGVCREDGSGWDETACDDGDICSEGTCEPEPVCSPGQTECFDSTTRLICRPGGEAYRQETCDDGQACVGGECVSGDPTGTSCTSAGDCAGGKCRCGTDESCTPTPTTAFCTSECTAGSCGPDEACVESDLVDGSSYDHCVPTCQDTCPLSGLTCVALPSRDSGSLEWVQGCYLDTVEPVGAQGCSSAEQCAGDTCLSDYFNTSMCSHGCDGSCPDGTACVELDGGNYCTPICGSGSVSGSEPCPLDPDDSRLDVSCAYRQLVGGGAKRVCVNPNR